MTTFADTLTERERKHARLKAYAATWSSCISEVMLDSSAIIILFITMNGGSPTFTMLSTGMSGIMCMFLMIPCAGIVDMITPKKAIKYAAITACFGFLLLASAPFWGNLLAKYIALAGCFFYCILRPLYSTAWYPVLDNFLRPQDRSSFFGIMRYSYMTLSTIIFFILGLVMGKNPPFWLMQIVIAVTGILVLGRWYFVDRLPEPEIKKAERYDLKGALRISIKNSSLVTWSLYSCFLTMGYTSLLPLALIYLKQHVQLGANTVQIISTVALAGSISAFFCFSFLVKRLGMRLLETLVHFSFMLVALGFFLLGKETPGIVVIASIILFFNNFCTATFMCINSIEMLSLARPGNKTMAMAFCMTYQAVGTTIGRFGTSLVLGAGILAPSWIKWGIRFSSYQTIFLSYAVILLIVFLLLPHLPSFVSKHEDYYEPGC